MDIIYLMWLHLKNALFPALSIELLRHFGSAEKVYLADKEAYLAFGIKNQALLRALMQKSLREAEKELVNAKRLGIQILGYGTEDYPKILNEIPDPPIILYVRGDASVLHKRNAFCIVGTRRSTAYGMSAALGVSEQLARCGMVIVSGVALGIDSAAHRGAVRGGGKTIGIMGCGLDVPYPRDNAEIRAAIAQNGALVSEFPLGTQPVGSNFPMRNRLLSAFSLGVAVMEAGERSGALITAKYAAEQGRDVYALPGNISSPMSAGTNQLISDGAMLLMGADAILADYVMRYPEFFPVQEFIEEHRNELEKKQVPEDMESALKTPATSDNEKIVRCILSKEPMHVDEIIRQSGLAAQMVLSTITILQIKGKIKEHPGNRFSL